MLRNNQVLRCNEAPLGVRRLSIQAKADVGSIRHEELDGTKYVVVPVVALIEGVLHPSNAPKPELALASEFGKFDGLGWNGRPIVLGHPERDGLKVSANSPDVLKEEEFGQIFNTSVEDGKLKLEAWINLTQVDALEGEVRTNVDRLLNGDMVEVSTGLFAEIEPIAGTHNEQDYFGVWRNVIPDHLAILQEGVLGACSIDGGCGAPRTNDQSIGSCDKCQAAQKPCDCATNGEAITSDTWIPYSDKPVILEGSEEGKHSVIGRLLSLAKKVDFGHIFKLRGNATLVTAELSDTDVRAALEAALDATSDMFTMVIAVFNDRFVYGTWKGLFMQSFRIAGDGAITLSDDSVAVRPVTEFVPVSVIQEGERNMTKEERVNALIANAKTRFTDTHKPWLETLEEEVLETLEPTEEETPTAEATAAAEAAEADAAAAAEATQVASGSEEPVKLEDYINGAPTAIQEVLNEGVQMQKKRRDSLVEHLKDNKSCDFSEDELKGMSLNHLERMAKLANLPSYVGNAGADLSGSAIVDNDSGIVEAPKVFPAAAAS